MHGADTLASVTGPAAERWRAALASWAIPEELVASSGRSPWGHPVARFAARADAEILAPAGASFERAVEALEEVEAATGASGSVLDVGAGAGAAGLPLLPWASALTAVDPSSEMLAAFMARASTPAAQAGGPAVPVRTVEGSWPEVAHEVGVHDVVVCHHVAYNVGDIGPFVSALTSAARHRVVLEIPPLHPLTWMNPLWEKFHGLARTARPVARWPGLATARRVDVDEATVLLSARGDDLTRLLRARRAGPRPGAGRRRPPRASSPTAARSSSR